MPYGASAWQFANCLSRVQVVHYREVYKASHDPAMWKQFSRKDHLDLTFSLIDEITASESYNGLIPFTDVADAKQALKLRK